MFPGGHTRTASKFQISSARLPVSWLVIQDIYLYKVWLQYPAIIILKNRNQNESIFLESIVLIYIGLSVCIRQANASYTSRTPMADAKAITTVGLEHEVTTFHNGKLRLTCIADIFRVYSTRTELYLDEERPRLASVLGQYNRNSCICLF